MFSYYKVNNTKSHRGIFESIWDKSSSNFHTQQHPEAVPCHVSSDSWDLYNIMPLVHNKGTRCFYWCGYIVYKKKRSSFPPENTRMPPLWGTAFHFFVCNSLSKIPRRLQDQGQKVDPDKDVFVDLESKFVYQESIINRNDILVCKGEGSTYVHWQSSF